MPAHTPADGNPFDWIVRTAPQVRADRQRVDNDTRFKRRAEAMKAMPALFTDPASL